MISLITSQVLRLFISLFFLIIGIKYRRYFLLLIPFLQYAALFMKPYPPEMNFIVCYAELIILSIFALQEGLHFKDKPSLYLFFFPFLSLPSLLCAQGNLYQSIFIIGLLSLSAFLYCFYLKNMEWLLNKNIFNLIVLVWVVFGISAKVYGGIMLGRTFPLSTWTYIVLTRSGGLGGSNHAGGIILFFLPFVKDYRILSLTTFFLLSTFSRGIYAPLVIIWIILLFRIFKVRFTKKKLLEVSLLIRKRNELLKALFLICIIFCLIWHFIPQTYKAEFSKEAFQRILGAESWGSTISEKIKNRTLKDDRWDIWGQSLRIFKKTSYQGIGLGGFAWGQELIGATYKYSNAHNMYLTLLCEGGIFFFLGFMGLLFYMFRLAFRYSYSALISLAIFAFYGLYSGEIYEVSRMASACDYYYLIFLLAYLTYMKKLRIKENKENA